MAKSPKSNKEVPKSYPEGSQEVEDIFPEPAKSYQRAPGEASKSPVRDLKGASKRMPTKSQEGADVPKEVPQEAPKSKQGKPCKHCGQQYGVPYLSHLKEKHPEILQAMMAKANEVRFAKKAQANGNGNHAETPAPEPHHMVGPEGLEGIPDGDIFPVEEKPKAKPTAKNLTTIPTTTLTPGVQVRVVPKAFTLTSDIIWQAMEALRNERNWPPMSPGDFIDTALHMLCKVNYGIILGGYTVEEKNGGRKYTEEEVRSIAAAALEDALKRLQEVGHGS